MADLKCPECGSTEVATAHEQLFMVNTGEHYCHSVKTYDANSRAVCLDCRWGGCREQLVADQQEGSDMSLYQNSGRTRRSMRIGRLFLHLVSAEDPRSPWWRRTWAFGGAEMLLGLCRFTNSDGMSVLSLIIGPMKVSAAWVSRGKL